MRKRYFIGVREVDHPENFKIVKRVLNKEDIGNFNPIFCRYKNQQQLVKSSSGDLDNLYIEVWEKED